MRGGAEDDEDGGGSAHGDRSKAARSCGMLFCCAVDGWIGRPESGAILPRVRCWRECHWPSGCATIRAEYCDGEDGSNPGGEEGAEDEDLDAKGEEINQACEHAFGRGVAESCNDQKTPGGGTEIAEERV